MERKARKSGLLARLVSMGLAILLLNIFSTMQLAQADAISQERMEKQQRYLEMRERERAEKKQADQRNKANKAVQKRNCEHATKQLNEYKTASALYDYDKSGKKVFLNKADRKKAEKQAAADVEKWCN
jgi:hypothetical protein